MGGGMTEAIADPVAAAGATAWFAVMVTGYQFRADATRPFEIDDPIGRAGFETFVPRMEIDVRRTARRGRSKRRVFVPALPGYVFVEMASGAWDWRALEAVPCVRGVVGIGNRPVPLRKADLDEFAARAQRAEFDRESLQSRHNLRAGDRVRIAAGSFNGHEAAIECVTGRAARMLISLFKTEIVAVVSLDNLDRVA